VEARDPAAPRLGEGRAPHRDEAEVEFNRIVAFSDGVFAIAITLLVFGLFIPEGVSDVTHTLLQQWTDLFAYGISFAVISKFWLAHHRFFAAVERFDDGLMGRNLVYLAFIGLVPFSSLVLGDYGDHVAAIVLYAINLACVNLAFQAEIAYVLRHGLFRPAARESELRYVVPTNLVLAGVFIVSIPVAFVSTLAATLMWLTVFLVGSRAANRLARTRA
jgi:uncharacterized membrane protein